MSLFGGTTPFPFRQAQRDRAARGRMLEEDAARRAGLLDRMVRAPGLVLVSHAPAPERVLSTEDLVRAIGARTGMQSVLLADVAEPKVVHLSAFRAKGQATDSLSTAQQIRAHLAVRPPVILHVPSLRDEGVILAVLDAAKAGHRVLAPVEAGDALGVLMKVLVKLPPERERDFAGALGMVVHQHEMLQDMPGHGFAVRRVTREILEVDPALRAALLAGPSDGFLKTIDSAMGGGMFSARRPDEDQADWTVEKHVPVNGTDRLVGESYLVPADAPAPVIPTRPTPPEGLEGPSGPA